MLRGKLDPSIKTLKKKSPREKVLDPNYFQPGKARAPLRLSPSRLCRTWSPFLTSFQWARVSCRASLLTQVPLRCCSVSNTSEKEPCLSGRGCAHSTLGNSSHLRYHSQSLWKTSVAGGQISLPIVRRILEFPVSLPGFLNLKPFH